MDHSEIDEDISFAPLNRRGAGEDQWRTSVDVVVVPPSPPTQTAAFRSQRINFAAAPPLAPPLLHHQSPCLLSNNNNNNNKIHPNAVVNSKPLSSAQDDNLAPPSTMAKKKEAVGTIPIRPSFHIPERTAIQISEDTVPMNTLLDRTLQYLREQSISYECEPDTGCFECVSPSMISFSIQLWRDNNNNKMIHVEVRRQDGCAIELNSIRRSFLRHVRGGLEPQQQQQHQLPPSRRRPMSSVGSGGGADSYQPSMKRRRSLSPYTGAGGASANGRQDALILCLRLLGSPLRDQQKLGLETLAVLTNSKMVGPVDAVNISRALVVGDSPLGLQLQQRLGDLMQREFQPALLSSTSGGSDPCHASPNALLYNIALRAISNALELVSSSSSIGLLINLDSTFWTIVMACLVFSLERGASRNPHDATLAAKCIRFLLPAHAHAEQVKAQQAPMYRQHQQQTSGFQPLPLRASLQKTVELGQAHHVSLAEESKKTLCYFQA